MAPSTRDRISVDLRGLKDPLFARAQALGVSPSSLVRAALAENLGREGRKGGLAVDRCVPGPLRGHTDRVRLCLRMRREQARAAQESAVRAGMNLGDYVGGLVANVPVLTTGGGRLEHVAALRASSAELSTLIRNIHCLTVVLRQANVEAARPYRQMLDTLDKDVRRHLEIAANVLAELQPRGAKPIAFSRAAS